MQKIRYWTTREVERLRSMEGSTAMEVALELGRGPDAVQAQARRLGVKLLPAPRNDRWPETTRERATRLWEEGHSSRRVSEMTGVPQRTVERWVYLWRNAA